MSVGPNTRGEDGETTPRSTVSAKVRANCVGQCQDGVSATTHHTEHRKQQGRPGGASLRQRESAEKQPEGFAEPPDHQGPRHRNAESRAGKGPAHQNGPDSQVRKHASQVRQCPVEDKGMDPRKFRLVHSHGYANERLGQGAKGIVPQNFRPSACKRPPNIQMTPSSIWSPRWPTRSDEPQAPTALATDTHLLSRIVSWLPIGTTSQAIWMRPMWLTRGNLGVAASSCHHQGRDRPTRRVRRVRLNPHGRHSPSSCRSCRVIEPARPNSERPHRPTRQATTATPHPRITAVRRPGSLDSLPTVGRQCRRRHSRPVRECTGRGDHSRSAPLPFTRHPGVVRTERSQVHGYPRFGREGLVRTGIAGSDRPPLRQGGDRTLGAGPGNRSVDS